jgi:phosphoribosyl 1,2-cyclic phosphodiesterase
LVIIEANHDRSLLENGPYPYWLKRRIASPYGHLSNDDAAEAARRCSERLQTLWLAHLSEENNRPELAITRVRRSLQPSFHIDVRTVPPRGLLRWSSLAPHERSVE